MRLHSWMDKLPDSTKISRLNIPGTHDTCAFKSASPISKTQNRSLKEQLEAGIRFIDIRCRHIEDTFAIHHGQEFLDQFFGTDVRDVCIDFLKANSSECIVMSIKQEHERERNKRSFEDTFDSYLVGNEDFWYFGDRIPSLGKIRGKIVLLRRFRAERTPKGIEASDWQDNATFSISVNEETLNIQDNYVVNTLFTGDVDNKWEKIKSLLDRAKSDTSDTWYINFTSGASLLAFPNAVADRINYRVYDYMAPENFPNRLGTFVIDFPDDNIIRRIISLNK